MVVHSDDGLDEISPAGMTPAWLVGDGAVAEQAISPADWPARACAGAGGGGDAEHNAGLLQAVLDGANGPVTDFNPHECWRGVLRCRNAPELLAERLGVTRSRAGARKCWTGTSSCPGETASE